MDALHQDCHVADAALAGQRLDAALAVVLEALGQPVPGLRGRRRLLEEGRVRVNGRQASAAYRVRQGDSISLSPALPEVFPDPADGGEAPRALSRQGRWQAFSNPQAGTASVWPGAAAAALRPPSLRCGPRAPSLRPGPCCNAWMPGRRVSSVPPWRMMRTAWTPRCRIFARLRPGGGAAKVTWPCSPVVWSRRPAYAEPWIWRSAVWSVYWMPRPLMPPAGPGSGPCTAGRASPAVLSPANCAGAFLCPSPLCPTV